MRNYNEVDTYDVLNPVLTDIFKRGYNGFIDEWEIIYTQDYINDQYRLVSVSDNYITAFDKEINRYVVYMRHHTRGWFNCFKSEHADFTNNFIKDSLGTYTDEIIEYLIEKGVAY